MIEAYLADPCGTLSIPYYKMIRMQMPPQLRVIHDRAFDGVLYPDETDARYFRLLHTLERLDPPLTSPGYTLRRLDGRHAPQLALLMGNCYPGEWNAAAALGLLRDPFAYAPSNMGVYTSDGMLVGCALARLTHNAVKGRSSGWPFIRRTGEGDWLVRWSTPASRRSRRSRILRPSRVKWTIHPIRLRYTDGADLPETMFSTSFIKKNRKNGACTEGIWHAPFDHFNGALRISP